MERAALYVAACGFYLFTDMLGDSDNILHKSVGVLEHRRVYALENVTLAIFAINKIRTVYVSLGAFAV
jgi:hypothetical protein